MVFNSEATEDIVAEDTKVVEKEAADSAADVEVPELGYGRIALGLVGVCQLLLQMWLKSVTWKSRRLWKNTLNI